MVGLGSGAGSRDVAKLELNNATGLKIIIKLQMPNWKTGK